MRTFSRSHRSIRSIGLTAIIVTLVLAACGSGATSAPLDTVGRGIGEVPAASGGSLPGTGGGDGQAAAPTGGPLEPGELGAVDDAKIIRTGTMDLEVSDLPAAIGAARVAILAMGGYIGASNTSNVDDRPYAEITYRIPVDRWEDALAALRALNGLTERVVAEQTQAVDVTGQVVDLDARIRNLKVGETALQAIAADATRVTDLLEIQAQITAIRGQIEQLEAQRSELGDRTSYATLTARFQLPAIAAIEVQSEGWDPGAIFDEASASLVGLLQGLAGAGIWLAVVWLPVVLILGLVVGIVVLVVRRLGLLGRSARPGPALPLGE